MAKNMVTKYGFSKSLGMIHYGDDDEEDFIGRDLAHAKGFSYATAKAIDDEVRAIIDNFSYASYIVPNIAKNIIKKCKNH